MISSHHASDATHLRRDRMRPVPPVGQGERMTERHPGGESRRLLDAPILAALLQHLFFAST
ncbi:MAG: hypothetical protein GVY25_06800 [Bacteroidetes bacterium]|nr:hypothetical protein [Bacteroidota bacterium]